MRLPGFKLYKFLTIALLFSALTTFPASGDECKNHIIFLPQTHEDPHWNDDSEAVIKSSPYAEQIEESQYRVAKFLEKARNIPAFIEGKAKEGESEHTLESLVPRADKQRVFETLEKFRSKFFPNGLPDSYDQLTSAQKIKLVQNNGPLLELILGNIPAIYSAESVHADAQKTVRDTMDSESPRRTLS